MRYGESDPASNLSENGATDEEIDFLVEGHDWDGYHGRRVELNAFTSGELVTWLEAKLEQHGVGKVIPDEHTLRAAWDRALETAMLEDEIAAIAPAVRERAKATETPDDLASKMRTSLEQDPDSPWDLVVADLAAE